MPLSAKDSCFGGGGGHRQRWILLLCTSARAMCGIEIMHKKTTPFLFFLILSFLSALNVLNADTISQENSFQTTPPETSTDTRVTAPAETDSAAASARKPQSKTGTKSRRDSTLRALLATLEKEDSLNALSPLDTAAALQNQGPSTVKTTGSLFRRIAQTTHMHRRPFTVAGAAAFIILVVLIAARATGKKAEKRFMTTTRLSLMDREVRRACVHIEKHFSDPELTPGIVCSAVVTGEPFLEALFQKELGMSIEDYIAQTRIHHAKQLIKENPEAEAATVAAQAGFADVEFFRTTYEKLAGCAFEAFPKK
jgi:AraC-like DNA-binding protein